MNNQGQQRTPVVCTHPEGILYGYSVTNTLATGEPFISAAGLWETEESLKAKGWTISNDTSRTKATS